VQWNFFEDKDPDEAMKYMDLLAENTQNWDTACTCEALVEFSLIHLVETCTILEKIMTSKPNLHL